MNPIRILAGVVISVQLSQGQSPPPKPEFDVAAIKLDTGCANRRKSQTLPSPGRLTLECQTVKSLIQVAYGFFSDGVSMSRKMLDVSGGPGWMTSDFYDIAARAENNARVEQMGGPMMQALLEDRFKLKVHRETKEVPVYLLTVAKGGAKLVPTKEGSCITVDLNHLQQPAAGETPPNYCGNTRFRRKGAATTFDSSGISMANLADTGLLRFVDRPLVDKTGLSGLFDVHVEFTPDSSLPGFGAGGGKDSGALVATPDASAPSIFTALQEQLGLKLVSGKGTVDVLIVDRLERPSEN